MLSGPLSLDVMKLCECALKHPQEQFNCFGISTSPNTWMIAKLFNSAAFFFFSFYFQPHPTGEDELPSAAFLRREIVCRKRSVLLIIHLSRMNVPARLAMCS